MVRVLFLFNEFTLTENNISEANFLHLETRGFLYSFLPEMSVFSCVCVSRVVVLTRTTTGTEPGTGSHKPVVGAGPSGGELKRFSPDRRLRRQTLLWVPVQKPQEVFLSISFCVPVAWLCDHILSGPGHRSAALSAVHLVEPQISWGSQVPLPGRASSRGVCPEGPLPITGVCPSPSLPVIVGQIQVQEHLPGS